MSIYRRKSRTEEQQTPKMARRSQTPTTTQATENIFADSSNQWVGLGEPDPEQSDQYSAWANRMRSKRTRNQEMIIGEQAPEPVSYWNTETVFVESERIAQDEVKDRPDPLVVHSLLEILDLRDGATQQDIAIAYKQLVKQHHPDKFVEADEETQTFHDERMREINTAYRSLRTLNLG